MVTKISHLTEDAMFEILSKLPVKSLLRFRCICKSCSILVKSHNFIIKHLRNYNNDNIRLIAQYMNKEPSDRVPRDGFSIFIDETLEDTSFQDLYSQMPASGEIMGPYDGIFCLYNNNSFRMTLWNLATREFRTLPKRKTGLPHYIKGFYSKSGFELDPVREDYKVILLQILWNEEECRFYEFTHVAIYNLSTDCWRDYNDIGLIKYRPDHMLESTYLNRVYYWLASDDNDNQMIISFHMGDEMFQEIQKPCTPGLSTCTLGMDDDSLSLILVDEIENKFEIWAMKETSFWIRKLTIGPVIGLDRALGFWKNGTLLIESSLGQLTLYDPSTRSMKVFGPTTLGFVIHNYKESLISVN